METSIPVARSNKKRGAAGAAPYATPCHLNPLEALAHLVNPHGATHDSPVLLPLVQQVEASPTTGIHQLCPPLFQSQTKPARLPLPIPGRTEVAAEAESNKDTRRDYGVRVGNGKQSVANSDGWQWRKYGEKLVKGSTNPRSYYKCSHAYCPAKKIVECTEKGGTVVSTKYIEEHCHPAPLTCRPSRFKPKQNAEPVPMAPPPVPVTDTSAMPDYALGVPGVSLSALQPLSSDGMLPIPETLQRGFPAPSQADGSTAAEHDEYTDVSGPEPSVMLHDVPQYARPMQASGFRSSMREIQDSPSKRLDALAAYAEEAHREYLLHSNSPEPAPASKRQRTEGAAGRTRLGGEEEDELPPVSGAQQLVDVADLEDGFRWRKYGEKRVKGNEYPRSYYKCTYPGCTVRKHMERHPLLDTKFIVTYEGQHEHPAPDAARRRRAKAELEEEEEGDLGDGEDSSPQPTSPQPAQAPLPHPNGQAEGAEAGQLPLQQQDNSFQQPPLPAEVPLLQFAPEALAGVGLSADALQSLGALGAVDGNGAALASLLRTHAQIDLAIAAQAQAMDAAAAGWDPLACLVTPRPNASPTGFPSVQAQAVPSAGTGRQVVPGRPQARQQVATTEA
ncbi:hypothetical protein Agub_g4661 [Astrephomene gubernaculifera]|uniref:WRKY domain-containing protein n=1 Tax=Astrephomene gubernaculifera TaxID=47775 RepID=A0AAD3HJY1_9CHLO|nr:hypothetical protein Agub_g4661 [Astrephomene gubernaculifera]